MVDAYFDKQEGEVREIALALRALVEARGPQLTCKLAWGFPCWSGNERVCSIIAHKAHVNLQLWSGNRLADEWQARISGTGKQLRHIKLRSAAEVDDEVSAIIDRAIELDLSAPEKVR